MWEVVGRRRSISVSVLSFRRGRGQALNATSGTEVSVTSAVVIEAASFSVSLEGVSGSNPGVVSVLDILLTSNSLQPFFFLFYFLGFLLAILKINSAKIKCFFEVFNSHNLTQY
jgi:hypothetical protein